jgi:hypothetical protein
VILLQSLKKLSTIEKGGYRHSGPLSKNAPAAFLRARFARLEPILQKLTLNSASWTESRSLATALSEGALARGLLRMSAPQSQDVDHPATECHKLSASEAPDPGRHHVGIPGDIISECPGDFIGIRRHMPGKGGFSF